MMFGQKKNMFSCAAGSDFKLLGWAEPFALPFIAGLSVSLFTATTCLLVPTPGESFMLCANSEWSLRLQLRPINRSFPKLEVFRFLSSLDNPCFADKFDLCFQDYDIGEIVLSLAPPMSDIIHARKKVIADACFW